MDYNNTSYEREIDLKDLMFVVLHRWKWILAAAMAMAFILGGYKAVSAYLGRSHQETSGDVKGRYEKELELYNQKILTYKREIGNLTEAIAKQQEYLEESVFMNMSPYDVWEARAEFFVETDYEIMPGMVYQNRDFTATVLQAYQSALTNAEFMERVAGESGMEARYLKELVSVSIGRSDEGYNNLLVIQVKHGEKEKAEELMGKFTTALNQCGEGIRSSVMEHTITEVGMSLGAAVDLALADRQRDERAQLEYLIDSLTAKQESLDELEKEKKPVQQDSFGVSMVKTAVKYGVLGGVMGAFAVVFFVSAGFVMSDKVSSAKELKYRFQIKILGCLPAFTVRNRSRFDAWLDKLEGRFYGKDVNREYDLIAVNILNYGEETGPVFVTGGASKDRIAQVAENLVKRLPGTVVVSGGDFLSEPESLKKLSGCGCVVLVEQCGVSSYSNVEAEIEKIGDLHKKAAGCIVIG